MGSLLKGTIASVQLKFPLVLSATKEGSGGDGRGWKIGRDGFPLFFLLKMENEGAKEEEIQEGK